MPGQNGGQIIKGDMVMRSSWHPERIPGLKCWLRCDASSVFLDEDLTTLCENNDLVRIWTDQTSNKSDFGQSNTSFRPIFREDGGDGFPAIMFRPGMVGGQFFRSVSSFVNGWTEASIYTVSKVNRDPPTSNTKSGYFSFGTSNRATTHPDRFGRITECFSSSTSYAVGDPTINLTDWHLYSVSHRSQYNVKINGISQLSVSATGSVAFPFLGITSLGESKTNAGSFPSLASYLDGFFAEVLIFNEELSPDDEQLLEDHLMDKYGIT